MSRFVLLLGVLMHLAACGALRPIPTNSTTTTAATVTGVASGRANAPEEKVYGLRTPGGRVYFVSQRLSSPLKEGDTVDIEVSAQGNARIRQR